VSVLVNHVQPTKANITANQFFVGFKQHNLSAEEQFVLCVNKDELLIFICCGV